MKVATAVSDSSDRGQSKRLAAVFFLALAVALVYGRGLRDPFILDDRSSVIENRSIRALFPLWDAHGPLAPDRETVTAGRPLVNLSLAINYHFGQLSPLGYHLTNLLIHALSATLLLLIVERSLGLPGFSGSFPHAALPLAFVVALVWALHPLQTEAVEYVSQRTEILMALCYLATLYGSLRYLTASSSATRNAWLAAAVIACLGGMASKEVMVSAPVMVLLYDRTFIAGSFAAAWRRSKPLYVGLFSCWFLLLALNFGAPRSQTAGFHLAVPAYSWWFVQCKILLMYLKLVVWPWPLVIYYQLPYLSLIAAIPWMVPVAVLILGTLDLVRRNRPAGFLGAWFFAILSPTLVVPILSEMAAERRMYLPLAAIAVLAVVGGYLALGRWLPDRGPGGLSRQLAITLGGAGALVGAYSLIDVHRLGAYESELALWQDTVQHQPNTPIVLVQLGVALSHAGQHEEGIERIRQAVAIEPDSAAFRVHLGSALSAAGRYDEAIQCLRETLALGPDTPELRIHLQIGAALTAADRTPEAIDELQEALRVNPQSSNVRRLLAANLTNAGRAAEAIPLFAEELQRTPGDASLRDQYATALFNAGQGEEAIAQYQQSLRLNPGSLDGRMRLARAYLGAGQRPQAIALAQETLNLARAHHLQQAVDEIEAWLKANQQPAAPAAESAPLGNPGPPQ